MSTMPSSMTYALLSAAAISTPFIQPAGQNSSLPTFFIPAAKSAEKLTQPLDETTILTQESMSFTESMVNVGSTSRTGLSDGMAAGQLWSSEVPGRLLALQSLARVDVDVRFREVAAAALRDSATVLASLADAGLPQRPAIGWDSDGAISLFIHDGDFSADFSVFGDGTYSFSARKGSLLPVLKHEKIGGPLPDELVAMLA